MPIRQALQPEDHASSTRYNNREKMVKNIPGHLRFIDRRQKLWEATQQIGKIN